jgi:hypothetical protein
MTTQKTLGQRLFACEPEETRRALEGIMKILICIRTIWPDARVHHTMETGRQFGFTEEETEGIVRGEWDEIIIAQLHHPAPSVWHQAIETISASDRLMEGAAREIFGNSRNQSSAKGLSIEGRRSLLRQVKSRRTSHR